MKATIQKWGNSLALRIPQAVARQIHVKEGDAVELSVGLGGLTIKPAAAHPTLDELLAAVTPENLHESTDWGSDLGHEDVRS
jgi:antitoxin MazE